MLFLSHPRLPSHSSAAAFPSSALVLLLSLPLISLSSLSSKAIRWLRRPAAFPPRRRRRRMRSPPSFPRCKTNPDYFLSERSSGREIKRASPFHLGSLIADLNRHRQPLGFRLVRLPIPRVSCGCFLRRFDMEESLVCNWGACRAILAILQWWGFNVTVIIMNKWIFQNLDFKFPLTVSCVHFICSSVGAYIAIKLLKIKPLIEVDHEDRWKRIFPMSFVFCINIVLGNVSLRYIPVSFMQTIKSFTPATTVFLQWLVWRKYFDWRIWTSLIPIVGGILLTSVTELSFNIFGFCAAMFGCLATSTKTILAESLLHGYKFDSINTVYYMAPFATMILALPAMLLEGSGVIKWFYTHPSIYSAMIIILSSGILAFCLNFSIFYVIHSTTAVTFNVAGNLKVAVAVLISWLIFKNPISAMNAVGCAVTLSGCTFYGYVRHKLSQQQPGTPRTPPHTPRSKLEMLPLVNDKQDKV